MPLSPIFRTKARDQWLFNAATFDPDSDSPITVASTLTLAAWGFYNVRLHRESLGLDLLTMSRTVDEFDAAPEIDYGGLVSLQDPNRVTRFIGRRILVPASAEADGETQQWVFAGPWFWLQRLVYKQTWQRLLVNGALVTETTSHLLLNTGDRAGVAAQIRHVLQFAIDQGCPIQIGTVDVPVVPFVTEITDQTCAQVIIDQLRFAPDAVTWIDYSTNPPTFHCRRKANLTGVSLPFGTSTSIIADGGLRIIARPDLQVDSVALRYERTDTLDGVEYLGLGKDIYPPGSDGNGLNAINATITLAGFNRTTVNGSILCEAIDTGSLAWWKRVAPRLQDPRVRNLAFSGGTGNVQRILQGSRTDATPNGTPSSAFPRFLVEGQLVDWMRDATDNALDWEQEEISAEFTFDFDTDESAGVRLEKVEKMRIPVHLVSTTAPAGVSHYSDTESEEEGEVQPTGLAQYLHAALSPLEYEGTVETVERECTGHTGPGNTLSITGTAQAGHATMAARVQSVDELIDEGRTQITFGPTPDLSVSDILTFLRATRQRRRWTRTSVQTDGENATNGSVQLGQATANNNTIPGDAQRKLFACQDGTKRVELDAINKTLTLSDSAVSGIALQGSVSAALSRLIASAGTGSATVEAEANQGRATITGAGGTIRAWSALCNGKILYPREETWCNPTTGQRRKIMVLCSDPYD